MKTISLGFSPCPNDTFIFYALVHRKVRTRNLLFREVLLDVETLNQRALRAELDVTKISFHAYGHLRESYGLLRAGGALGRGCGPLIISKDDVSMDDLRGRTIAIPGRLTTAYLLLQLYDPLFRLPDNEPNLRVMPFHKIVEAVARRDVEAGLIIHESRFTYSFHGLKQVLDLGQWWEKETGLPLPLGGIIARRSLGHGLHGKVNRIIGESVKYAFENRPEPMTYIKKYSQDISDDVIDRHIGLYVNDFSVDVGDEGKDAVKGLLMRAEQAGIIPSARHPVFV